MCSAVGPLAGAAGLAIAGLALWVLVNGGLVELGLQRMAAGLAGAGFRGGLAIVSTGTLLARMQWLNFLRNCGEHSIVIYLAFFLPMAATRTLLLKAGFMDIGTISLIVTVVGVAGALAIWRRALRPAPISCSSAPTRSGSYRRRRSRRCRRRSGSSIIAPGLAPLTGRPSTPKFWFKTAAATGSTGLAPVIKTAPSP